MDAAPTPAPGETLTFDQTINPGSFLGLSLKNGLLNLVTLTLYRFWGKTEVRKRIWSHISLNGEPFEYTGRGKELFIGFLIALVIIGGPYLAVVLAAHFLHAMFAILLLPLYISLFILLGSAIFLTFRYVASRTTWRGIRFQLKGEPFKFGLSYLGYSLLSGITLGWFAPAMTMRIAEKLWGGLRFGDQPLVWRRSYDDNIYGAFAIAWIVGVFGYIAFIAALMPLAMANAKSGAEPGVMFIVQLYAYALIYALIVTVASVGYHAAVLRTIAKSIRLGEARFSLSLKAVSLLGLTLTNLALLVFSLGLLMPFVEARTARFLVSRLSSTGEAPLAEALQAPRGPKTGEGLADAFDFSPF